MTNFNDCDSILTHAARFFRQAARRLVVAGVSGALVFSLAACASSASSSTEQTGEEVATEQVSTGQTSASDDAAAANMSDGFVANVAELFSNRDLDSSYDEKDACKISLADKGSTVDGSGASVDGSTVTITAEGTYVVLGTLSEGRIVVDVDDSSKVQLVLDGANITSSTGTALYVRNADKVFVTLADGSSNSLSATGEATEEDEHTLDGALYSCDDLTINGGGSLDVASGAGHGIVGKDELTLVSGTINVDAAKSAIQAKDSVAVKDGTYTLKAGTDGIHVEHESNTQKGFAYVAGGTFSIECGRDGIDASNDILIDGGSLNITAGDDGIHSEYDLVINGGTIRIPQSYEALEGATVTVEGGDIEAVASDDGINATGVPSSTNTDDQAQEGQMPQMSDGMETPDGEMPQMPDGEMPQMPENGQMPDGKMPEEGNMPTPPGFGEGSGDGFGNKRMGGGGGVFENDDTASVTISGGKLVITSGGDGLDSNGSLTISGGETYVNGPTSDGDGILDFGGTGTITGGTILALGSAGMAQGFDSSSSQGSMLVSASGSQGDLIELKDASGNVLASYTALKDYQCVIVSAPGVVEGGTYTLTFGSNSKEVTLDSSSYSDVTGTMGGMGGMGNKGGQDFGARPDSTTSA